MNLILQDNTLSFGNLAFPFAIGAGGIKLDKVEGDMATPVGEFPFRRVFYRADRIPAPLTRLPIKPTEPHDGWCDDIQDPFYNQHVQLPYKGRHEQLWREDHVYDLILVVGHNDNPVIKGNGSAVFIHLCRPDLTPTHGCVALSQENLLQVLADCSLQSCLVVKP
jgi:L,D-peptidoglycan transpeptidase YkuD (ErfK/YbiS/YcfS/YnhG family)